MPNSDAYSLRQRYLFLTSALTLMFFAFSWLGQSYVTTNSQRHLRNIEQRNQISQTVRIMRNSVLEVEKDLDAFMWDPSTKRRAEVHSSIDRASHAFDLLKNAPWFTTLGYSGKLNDFGIDVDSLHPKLDHVMETRLNTRRNIPVITAIEQTLHDNHSEFLVYGRELIHLVGKTEGELSGQSLTGVLNLLLQRWDELSDNLARYIEARRNDPFSSTPQQYTAKIELLFNTIMTQLNGIAARDAAGLEERGRTLLRLMRAAMIKWQQGYQQIKTSNPDEYLRTDIPYLKHTVEPHFEHLWRYLSALDQNIERYASNEAGHQKIITETISNGVWAVSVIGLILVAMGFLYFERGILHPIARVARALKAEARGDTSLGLPQVNSLETQHLIDAFDEMRNQVQDRQQALEHQALHDSLTSLPNRYHWQNALERHCRIAGETGQELAVIMLGLDRFKDVNDTLGHRIGDRVLQLFGERLKYQLRPEDTVARLGSDEFAILLPATGQEGSQYFVRKLLEEMEHPFQIEQINLYVGCSIGIALYPQHSTKPAELTRFADIAMDVAKKMKNGYALYEHKHDTNSLFKLSLATDLRHVIQNDALQLYYQPQRFLHNDEFAGMEVLLRWRHSEHGLISPEEFIPLAEQTGMIHPITLWVMEQSFAQMARWQKNGQDPGLVSVNISVFNLEAGDFVDRVDSMMKQYDINAEKVMLEITETAMMADPINAKSTLDKLHRLGLKLAIDDFGTGFSSLAYIKQLPVHELKIDKSFVSDMPFDENDAVIVRSTIDLAHNLGLKVVAEGVESEAIVEQLRELQCDIIQGHWYGKPMPLAEIEKMLPPLKRGGKVRHLKDFR